MGFTSAYERLAHRPLLSGKEHLVTATAKLLQQPPDSTCPLGKFYLYLDMEHYNATWNTNQKNLCHFQSGFCDKSFVARLQSHPCRTETLASDTPIAVANPLQRAISRTWHSNAPLDVLFNEGYESSLKMLRNLPQFVRSHPFVYLFEGAEHQNMRGFDSLKPPQAITFTTGDPMWAWHKSRTYEEPKEPKENEACYLYSKQPNVVALPYHQPFHNSYIASEAEEPAEELAAARANENRPYEVFYFAGIHGMGPALRSRLYTLCESAQKSGKTNWTCPRKPFSHEKGFKMLEQTKFCFIPVGDAPGRVFMFDVLMRGCVPVLFSSCPQSAILQSHTHLLPADPIPPMVKADEDRGFLSSIARFFGIESADGASEASKPAFGKRKWSLLLNQTAVMTSDTYLMDALGNVSDADVKEMRAAITDAVAERITFHQYANDDDALGFAIQHMLRKGKGLPAEGPEIPEDFVEFYPDPHAA